MNPNEKGALEQAKQASLHEFKFRQRRTQELSEYLQRTFNLIDLEGSGSVDYSSFSGVLSYFRLQFDDYYIKQLFELLDDDGNGRIDYEEFSRFVLEPHTFQTDDDLLVGICETVRASVLNYIRRTKEEEERNLHNLAFQSGHNLSEFMSESSSGEDDSSDSDSEDGQEQGQNVPPPRNKKMRLSEMDFPDLPGSVQDILDNYGGEAIPPSPARKALLKSQQYQGIPPSLQDLGQIVHIPPTPKQIPLLSMSQAPAMGEPSPRKTGEWSPRNVKKENKPHMFLFDELDLNPPMKSQINHFDRMQKANLTASKLSSKVSLDRAQQKQLSPPVQNTHRRITTEEQVNLAIAESLAIQESLEEAENQNKHKRMNTADMIHLAIAKSMAVDGEELSVSNVEVGTMLEVKIPWSDKNEWKLAFVKGIIDDEVGQILNIGLENSQENCFVPNVRANVRRPKNMIKDINVYTEASFADFSFEFEYDDAIDTDLTENSVQDIMLNEPVSPPAQTFQTSEKYSRSRSKSEKRDCIIS